MSSSLTGSGSDASFLPSDASYQPLALKPIGAPSSVDDVEYRGSCMPNNAGKLDDDAALGYQPVPTGAQRPATTVAAYQSLGGGDDSGDVAVAHTYGMTPTDGATECNIIVIDIHR
jgi:hypothetical protein